MIGAASRSRSSASAAVVTVASLIGGLLVVSITNAGAAGPPGREPTKTIPTLPTTTSAGSAPADTTRPETSAAPATTDESPSATEVDTGIILPAGAEMTRMFATANQLLTPTADVAAVLGQFAIVPDGIPTPADAMIEEFSIHYDGPDAVYTAEATFTTSATPEDTAIFYETAMTASGFALSSDDVQANEQTRRLGFDPPDSTYDGASVELLISSGTVASVTLTIVDRADPDVLAAFDGWARGMPTIEDGVPVEAELSAARNPGVELFVSTRFEYDDRSPDELTAQIRDAIASGAGSGFRIDEEVDDGTATISMLHPVIDSPVATISAGASDVTSMELSGSLSP